MSSDNRTYCAFVGSEDLPHDGIALVDAELPFGQVASWVGDATRRIDNAGRGGGAEPGITLWEIINNGLLAADVLAMSYGAYLAALRRQFSEHAREAREWQDSDVISPRLEQLVKAERGWTRRDFDLR